MRKKHIVKYPELEAEMARNGDSQRYLASKLEIDPASVSRKLTGKQDWTITEIKKICELYGKDFCELFK